MPSEVAKYNAVITIFTYECNKMILDLLSK